jgi:hypothetical protein
MESKLRDFLFAEGLRQDSLIHSIASALGTKAGLYMVFAAFVFSAEAALSQAGQSLGLLVPKPLLIVSLLLSLTAIVVLLQAVAIKGYKTPPTLPNLQAQAEQYLGSTKDGKLSEDEKFQEIRTLFVASLSRSIGHNVALNEKIAVGLEWASKFIVASVVTVLVALLWGIILLVHSLCVAHPALFRA